MLNCSVVSTLCNPMDRGAWRAIQSMGILQARILEWIAMPSSRGSSQPKNRTRVSCVAAAAAKSLQSCPTLCDPIDGSPLGSPSLGFSRQEHWSGLPFPSPMPESESEVAQSCPTLRDPMNCSLPGSSIHGIFQARVLEWGAIAFSVLRCRQTL